MKAFEEAIITQRLIIRRLGREDWKNLATILQDEDAMYAYEHAFSDDEVSAWLDRQLLRYEKDSGLGLLGVVRREDGQFVGQCGLTLQNVRGQAVPEIGYLLVRKHWHQGYATEAAMAVRDYAFSTLGLSEVWSIIRENNFASQAVARRLGMEPVDEIVKHYYGMDMRHICFRVRRPEGA